MLLQRFITTFQFSAENLHSFPTTGSRIKYPSCIPLVTCITLRASQHFTTAIKMLPGFWGVVLSAPPRKRAGSGWGKIYGNETSVPPTSLHVDNNGGAGVNFDPKQVTPHAPIYPLFRPIIVGKCYLTRATFWEFRNDASDTCIDSRCSLLVFIRFDADFLYSCR